MGERKDFCNISDCIDSVDKKMADKFPNAELSKTFQFTDDGIFTTVLLPVMKKDKKIRGAIPSGVAPSYCPFCGGERRLVKTATDEIHNRNEEVTPRT